MSPDFTDLPSAQVSDEAQPASQANESAASHANDSGTGDVTESGPGPAPAGSEPDPEPAETPAAAAPAAAATPDATPDATADPAEVLAAERLLDLQRLQAEYVNYKRRVERDRAVAGDQAVARIVESLLPVLDDIYLARQHGDLEGTPFASIADKLDATLVKQGVQRYGQPGEAFDPTEHEAIMRSDAELAVGTSVTTVVQVLQPGYRLGERVLRPARVAVADPQ